jgi:hypothetical protein
LHYVLIYLNEVPLSYLFLPIIAFIGAAFLFSEQSFARETPRVLPKGIYRARIVGVVTSEVKDTFNEKGQSQNLAYSLNRSLTVNDLAANADAVTSNKLQTLIASLNTLDPGLGTQLANSSVNLYSDFSVQQQISLFALEKGVTDRLSLGIRAPIVRRVVRNRFSVDQNQNATTIGKAVGNLSADVSAGLGNLAALDTASFEKSLFTAKGYEPPRDFEKTQLGDVEFGGKYNFYKSEKTYSSVLLGFAAPTGAKSDLQNPFDKGNSKESWCYAVQLLQEVYPANGFTLGGAAKLGYSFKDTRDRAVPLNENDSLPSLLPEAGQVQSVARQRGAQFESEVSAHYKFGADKFGIWSAYQYSSKGKDRFSGPGDLYYAGLEKNSEWQLQAGEFGVEFSTIPLFRKGKFSVPLEVSLLHNRAFTGKNTPQASYTRMDFMLYF